MLFFMVIFNPETLVSDWRKNYYEQLPQGADGATIYNRAEKIQEAFNNYMTGTDPAPNVIFPLLYYFVQVD